MNVDPVAQTAYGREADAYERARPAYPPDAIAWLTRELGLRGGVTVVDVGAGTGKLTRALAETGARVVAVEPVPEMAARLREIDVDVVVAAAEALPLSDASADAITVAQALHWFDLSRALAEFARVLRSDGLLALAWNRPDVQDPVQARLAAVLRERLGHDLYERQGFENRPEFERADVFRVAAEARFAHVHDAVIGEWLRSLSFLGALSPRDLSAVLDAAARELPRRAPLAFATEVYLARRA